MLDNAYRTSLSAFMMEIKMDKSNAIDGEHHRVSKSGDPREVCSPLQGDVL